jgi:3-oxoacyl-[acyl-carrier protein] reductase
MHRAKRNLRAVDLGLTGRVALVTGASKGIGAAIAAELEAEGARVAASSRSTERFAWDTSDVDGAGPLVDAVETELGPVDILVCNTGGPPAGEPLSFTPEQWQAAYRSLVLAPMALVERVLPGMRERGWGRVLNVVSSSVREPIVPLMLSNTHRSATVAGFKTLARRYAADGVTFNSVLPGRIATDRLRDNYGSLDAAEEAAKTQVPAGRLGTPADLAAAAVFLASERAGYVTGETLAVDGGLLQSI